MVSVGKALGGEGVVVCMCAYVLLYVCLVMCALLGSVMDQQGWLSITPCMCMYVRMHT